MQRDERPVVRLEVEDPGSTIAARSWLGRIPAVQQLQREGMELPAGVTFLVGENGSGKSTLVEAVATAFGLSPEGGSRGSRHSTRPSESQLGDVLRVHRGIGAPRQGFFLRAETMHGWYTYLEANPQAPSTRRPDPVFHEMSHGESFLSVLATRFEGPGFYCLDEPEAALSFSSTLSLIGTLHDLVRAGGQVLCATHSPVLAAMPGARIVEVGEWGLRESSWEDLELVQHWRRYLEAPERYLRHVLG